MKYTGFTGIEGRTLCAERREREQPVEGVADVDILLYGISVLWSIVTR